MEVSEVFISEATSRFNVPESAREGRLRRRIGLLGAFSLGYADVGAGIYLTLGLVARYAGPATPIAFMVASISYLLTAMSYAELSSAIPEAGGGMTFAMKAFGRLASFIAGWSLLLDYVVTGSIFALATTGYLGHLIPILHEDPYFGVTATVLVAILAVLNIIGIRESVRFSSVLVLVDIAGLLVVMTVGYATSFKPFFSEVKIGVNPSLHDFVYASTLAMASYLGIEVISQAVEETRRVGRTIPLAVKLVSAVVIGFSLAFSTLAIGVMGWEKLASSYKDPAAMLAEHLPYGRILGVWVSIIGMTVCYAAANTGVVGVSRMAYAMARDGMLPGWLGELHPKFYTPYKAVILFSLIQLALAMTGHLGLAADLYNFGALLSYTIVNLSVVALRIKDPYRYRPFKVPGNIPIRVGRKKVELPLSGVAGAISTFILWLMVIWTHEEGRNVGFAWIAAGLAIYHLYARNRKSRTLSP